MSLPKMETDVRNIEKLAIRPNATDGLGYKALQQVFDKAGADIQSFLNNTLIPALDSGIGGVDIDALQEAQGAAKEMAFPVFDPNVGVNAKLLIADILPLAVTVTKAADGTMTSDKTFAQVRAAFNAGRPVFCVYENIKEQWNPVILTLAECENGYAAFTRYTEVYQGDTRLVLITLSASGALDETSKIDASSIAYSNTTDEESKLAADVKAFLDLLYQKLTGLGASDVSYSGSIGEYDPKNVSAALEALMNYTDDKVDSIPVTKNATADYNASGASSVEAWATMAKTGDATKYRVAAGRYQINLSGFSDSVAITDVPGSTVRVVKITECSSDPFVYLSVYSAKSPGATPVGQVNFSSEENFLYVFEKNLLLPYYGAEDQGKVLTVDDRGYPKWKASAALPTVGAADNGSFLRVVNGAWAAAQLTDVSEVGA